MPSDPRAGAQRVGRLTAAAAGLLIVFHFSSFDIASTPLVTDVRYFVYYAWQVSEGAVPHVDFFENKPQLSVFLSAGFYDLAEALGADPLLVIRAGQLALAAVAAWLSFVVFRRLGGTACGWIGLAASLVFGLLGALPAVGTLPKLAMMVLGPAAALLAHRRRWVWAGTLGGLAFFDWQMGGAAWLAVAVAAVVDPQDRWRALRAVCLGGALAVAPFAIYYASQGALAAAFDQLIVATLSRGASSLEAQDLSGRLARAAALGRGVGAHLGGRGPGSVGDDVHR